MRRREFLFALSGGVAAMAPVLVGAQQRIPIVGLVADHVSSVGTRFNAEPLMRNMKELGLEHGRNYQGVFLWTERQTDRFPALVAVLVARGANVIVALGNQGIEAAQRATITIPIVGMADDLVKSGLAQSMSRPGSNTTGVSILASELDVKRLELLHEAIPSARRIGVLADPTTISTRHQLDEAARVLDLELIVVSGANREEVSLGLDALTSAHVDGVNVLASPVLSSWQPLINERLNKARLPAIYQWPEAAQFGGGLFAYGARSELCFQYLAALVVKILRGARPEDLPIQQPTHLDFIVNLKTAREIGFNVPASLLDRADEVIE